MAKDLEEFRIASGLSYRGLAALIDESHPAKTRAWALGQAWPQADKLELIFAATGGEVTLIDMHRRRLQWLKENKGSNIAQPQLESMAELHR